MIAETMVLFRTGAGFFAVTGWGWFLSAALLAAVLTSWESKS